MSELAERIMALSPEQREVLMRRLQDRGALPQPSPSSSEISDPGAITPVSRDGDLPLSFAQERLWILDQLQPGGLQYIISTPFRLMGQLDIRALEQAINIIIQRHEALRTIFNTADGQPSQIVLPSLRLLLALADLQGLPDRARENVMLDLVAEELQRSFDLARGPLLRAGLVRLDTHEHVLALTMHHIVFDGWSMSLLFRELDALYTAALRVHT